MVPPIWSQEVQQVDHFAPPGGGVWYPRFGPKNWRLVRSNSRRQMMHNKGICKTTSHLPANRTQHPTGFKHGAEASHLPANRTRRPTGFRHGAEASHLPANWTQRSNGFKQGAEASHLPANWTQRPTGYKHGAEASHLPAIWIQHVVCMLPSDEKK